MNSQRCTLDFISIEFSQFGFIRRKRLSPFLFAYPAIRTFCVCSDPHILRTQRSVHFAYAAIRTFCLPSDPHILRTQRSAHFAYAAIRIFCVQSDRHILRMQRSVHFSC